MVENLRGQLLTQAVGAALDGLLLRVRSVDVVVWLAVKIEEAIGHSGNPVILFFWFLARLLFGFLAHIANGHGRALVGDVAMVEALLGQCDNHLGRQVALGA